MGERIKLKYLEEIKKADQTELSRVTQFVRKTFDRYISINKHLLSSQFWNKMEAKQNVSDCWIFLVLIDFLDDKRKQQLSRLVCISVEYCLTNHCRIYDSDHYLKKVILTFINSEKDTSIMFCFFCMMDYCCGDVQTAYYNNIVKAKMAGILIEYYVDLLGMITSQNKEAVFAVIQKLKEAGAQRADIEKAIEYVCLCG